MSRGVGRLCSMADPLKMYILIPESLPLGFALVATAHASLACYLAHEEEPETRTWLEGSFRKVVCKADAKAWERAKALERASVLTESALEGQEVAIALAPREVWPRWVRFLPLYR